MDQTLLKNLINQLIDNAKKISIRSWHSTISKYD